MSQVFKSLDLVGVSNESFTEAVRVAVRRAGETMRKLRWLEVIEQRANIDGADVKDFQVTVRVWFELEED